MLFVNRPFAVGRHCSRSTPTRSSGSEGSSASSAIRRRRGVHRLFRPLGGRTNRDDLVGDSASNLAISNAEIGPATSIGQRVARQIDKSLPFGHNCRICITR